MNFRSLPLRNLARKPGRTGALILLTAFLALSIFGGSAVVLSLRSGLKSLEARLGADVIVVPANAKSKVNLENMYLQGTAGYFYMDASVLEKIRGIEGVEKAAPQIFLASLRADCCSMPVQVIGIDQEADFTVQPWIEKSYGRALGERDVLVGSKVNSDVGGSLRIYNVNCPVVGRLESTGTGLDTAVYASMDTIRLLLDAAREMGRNLQIEGKAESVVSAVYVKVRDDWDVEKVANEINIHIRKVEAVRTRNMITSVSDSLSGVSSTVAALLAVVWVLAFVILFIAFTMLIHERKREFAVLRALGASRRRLGRMILAESALVSLGGGALGILLAAAVVFPFASLIETRLGLPFLTPGIGRALTLAAATLLITLLAGPAASAHAARRLSRVDPGSVLREGN